MGSKRARRSLWERFWSKVTVDPVTGCWLWKGGIGRRRHSGVDGRLRGDGTTLAFVSPHRQVTVWAHGAPPSRAHHAAHSCDTDLCCNPAHLRWKSPSENELEKQYVDVEHFDEAAPF